MGSGLGVLQGAQLLSGLFGGLLGLTRDYPRAQQAAEETTASQNAAIYGSEDKGTKGAFEYARDFGTHGQEIAGEGRRHQLESSQGTFDKSMTNLNDWSRDYFARGGMLGQAQGLANDYLQRTSQANQGLAQANQAAQGVLQQIPDYQRQYGDQRKVAYSQLDELGKRTDATQREVRDTYDIAGMKETAAGIKNDLMNIRGASEIAGAVQPDMLAKQQALQDLEANKSSMTPQQYLANKQQINESFNGRIRDTSQKIADQKTQEWAAASTELEKNLTVAKSGLASNLTTLTAQYGTNAASILNSVTASLNGETSFINDAVKNATEAGAAYSQATNEATRYVTDLQWQAMNADEKVRAISMVDGPNALMAAQNASVQATESQYTSNLFAAMGMESAFTQLGLDMQFSFSPSFASIGPYFQQITNALQQGYNNQLTTNQYGQAVHQANQANAMGWAGVGVGAMNAFGPSATYSPATYGPDGQTGGGWGFRFG